MRRRQMFAMKAKETPMVRLDVPMEMPEKEKKKLVAKKRGRPRKQEV